MSGRDIVLKFLTTLNHDEHWDVLGRFFKISSPKFEQMTSKLAVLMSNHTYKLFNTDLTNEAAMYDFVEK